MSIDERLDRLTERQEALSQSVESLSHSVHELWDTVRRQAEQQARNEERWERLRRALRAGFDAVARTRRCQMMVVCPHGHRWLADNKGVVHIPIPNMDRCPCGETWMGRLTFVGGGGGIGKSAARVEGGTQEEDNQ